MDEIQIVVNIGLFSYYVNPGVNECNMYVLFIKIPQDITAIKHKKCPFSLSQKHSLAKPGIF